MIILTLVTFFAILGVIVIVHELGHYVTARRAGVKVEEFGLGIPPRMFGAYKDQTGKWKLVGPKAKDIPETIWSLNWIPLGGFVKIKGEEGQDANDEDSFGSKSIMTRAIILTAGVTMNIILAAVLLSIGLLVGSPQVVDPDSLPPFAKVKNIEVRVIEILAESPAEIAGLEIADTILTVDSQVFTKIEQYQVYINQQINQTVNLEIKRGKELLDISLVPVLIEETGKGGMGVGLIQTGLISYPWYAAPVFGVWETLKMVGAIFAGFFLIIKSLIFGQGLIGEVYGPVGIATLVGDAVQLGFLYVIQFTAILSVIIAVINYLPIPAQSHFRQTNILSSPDSAKTINS